MKFDLKVNDREYVETVYMNDNYSYDLFKNNLRTFTVEVKKNNINFVDEKGEMFSGQIIYQSYDEWVDETDNLITLHNLDDIDLSEESKQFIYFIEATIQLFYDLSTDATWPDNWWSSLDLNKIVNYKETNGDLENVSTIEKLKNLFRIK